MILEAAGNDPLRAQEIEDQLNQEWFDRWQADNVARTRADEAKHGR